MFGGQKSNDGVGKKLISQVSELSRQGLDVELVLVSIGDIHYPSCDFLTTYRLDTVPVEDLYGRLKRAYKIRKIFGETIDSLEPADILYYRYSNAFPLYYPNKYFKLCRSCKVVTEHQTKELEEFKLNKNTLIYWSEFFFGKLLRKQSDAIIGVTDEITRYEIVRAGDPEKPHLTIGNGLTVDSVPIRQAPRYIGDIHLLCVANVSRWHGLDRFLRGLATFYGKPKVILHIVGDGPEIPYLREMASNLKITNQVIFHGFQTGESLDVLFDQCHIAVGSLGIHRKGLKQTSELKAREYCARGIPFIIASVDSDFPKDFIYIFHIPATEDQIDINQVIMFAENVCADINHPQKMRRYAEEHLDWSIKVKKLKGFLEVLVDES